jgi:hypothetical protein
MLASTSTRPTDVRKAAAMPVDEFENLIAAGSDQRLSSSRCAYGWMQCRTLMTSTTKIQLFHVGHVRKPRFRKRR